MRAGWVVLMVLVSWSACFAQLSPEEAYQKLQERQKQRQAGAGATSQPAAPTTRGSGMAHGKLLHDAWDALMARRFAPATPMFDSVLALDTKDAVAYEGRAICRYEVKQYKQADRDMEQAYNLSKRSGSSGPARQTSIGLAATSSMNDNPMRSVKILRGMMEALEQDSKLDEMLQNDLGIALSKANGQSRKLPYFQESLKYYKEYDEKLAQEKKDNTARWGTKWVEVATAERKWTAYQSAAADADQAASQYDHSLLFLDQSKELMIELHSLRLHSDDERIRWTNQYKQAIVGEQASKIRLAKSIEHLNSVEKPPFPDRIEYDWREPR